MGRNPPIPPSFTARKNAILASLSTPDDAYTDLSPKGTVDEAIKPLIDHINGLEGVVTTSSCAGRISVFLEGSKQGKRKGKKANTSEDICEDARGKSAVPGGKATRLGMSYTEEPCVSQDVMDVTTVRLARFQFEPMILHVMTASLHHAQPVLTAAIIAGFRESGIQSLKNLDDANAFPMVAIRTAGLALESIVGSVSEREESENRDDDKHPNTEEVESLVSEGYLAMLMKLANERFKTNAARMRRFEEDLFRREAGSGTSSEWEDSKARQERKRAEGLKLQEEVRNRRMKEANFDFE